MCAASTSIAKEMKTPPIYRKYFVECNMIMVFAERHESLFLIQDDKCTGHAILERHVEILKYHRGLIVSARPKEAVNLKSASISIKNVYIDAQN